MIKNDLFLRALKGETVDRPPVWMMRQAGRYLPEFMEIKKKYDFFTRCRTPELASEITVQPIRRYGMDAAILFSDILVIPQAMNIEVEMKPDFGPYLPKPVRDQKGPAITPATRLFDPIAHGALRSPDKHHSVQSTVMDSGASCVILNDKNWFRRMWNAVTKICTANGAVETAHQEGEAPGFVIELST